MREGIKWLMPALCADVRAWASAFIRIVTSARPSKVHLRGHCLHTGRKVDKDYGGETHDHT